MKLFGLTAYSFVSWDARTLFYLYPNFSIFRFFLASVSAVASISPPPFIKRANKREAFSPSIIFAPSPPSFHEGRKGTNLVDVDLPCQRAAVCYVSRALPLPEPLSGPPVFSAGGVGVSDRVRAVFGSTHPFFPQ